ncbi:hypothetical protein QE152_g30886 [Popillia japonica]|uniref:Uncharacterized protein n=1 Tax=Popillia japonica TaxID=7064 RepID=A0AAW1JDN3_POPJA
MREDEFDSDDDLQLTEWLERNQQDNTFAQADFNEHVHFDDNLVKVELLSDDAIIAGVSNKNTDSEAEDDERGDRKLVLQGFLFVKYKKLVSYSWKHDFFLPTKCRARSTSKRNELLRESTTTTYDTPKYLVSSLSSIKL